MRERKHNIIPGLENPDKQIQDRALMHRVTSHKGAGRVGPAASTAHATETAEGWRKYQGAATGGKNGVKREEKRHMRQDNTNGVPGASRDRTRKKLFMSL